MKIQKLEIKDYLQFKDLELDLTYPKGHQKEGQPLDKICIIGQSGVGKTNLLNIINRSINYFNNPQNKTNLFPIKSKIILQYDLQEQEHNTIIEFNNNSNIPKKNKLNNELIYLIDVVKRIDNQLWNSLKTKNRNYQKERLEHESKLFNKLLNTNYSKEESIKDMKEWKSKNENIIEKISDILNEILIMFNLELKIDEDTNSYEDLIIKNLSNDKIIKYDNLSTGSKNLISTFIPLKIQNPKDSIIIIDEPENSFYPDIQRMLTDLYMEVGENNQLIFATHSP